MVDFGDGGFQWWVVWWLLWVVQQMWVMGLARSLCLVTLPLCDSGGCVGFQVVVVGFDCCTSGDCCEEIEEKREKQIFYII